MGRASRSKDQRRRAVADLPLVTPDLHLPDPRQPVLPGSMDPKTKIATIPHGAHYWHALPSRAVQCDLCYRQCVLKPGDVGWCKIRRNDGGRVVLTDHGVLGSMRTLVMHFWAWRQHAKHAWVGGVGCTAGCSFCTSTDLALHPERLPWGWGERTVAQIGTPGKEGDGGWGMYKGMVHPEAVMHFAETTGCTGVYFGANEATLTYEYTYDTARMAKQAGLSTNMDTNGFTSPAAIRALAPFMDMVYVGCKLHLDPEGYARRMRSAGAVEHVKTALKTWAECGVKVIIADVLYPPHWLDDDRAGELMRSFYSWIAEELGPHTPLELRPMLRPDPNRTSLEAEFLLPRGATITDVCRAENRVEMALGIAQECGLTYVFDERTRAFYCHSCGFPLLERLGWPVFFQYTADDGRCLHCGAQTPFVPLPEAEYAMIDLEGRHSDAEREEAIAMRRQMIAALAERDAAGAGVASGVEHLFTSAT